MNHTQADFVLYVDGACRGNPGVGGWGALIIDKEGTERELFGGALDTTNNRMELTAALEGVKACPVDATLEIHTDSTYVQKGMTEWMKGWKAKNWKNVKNPDLWQQLDATCQNRAISWHWIKGHAGHAGNERADTLANLGADSMAEKKTPMNEDDWLLNDPFGLAKDEYIETHSSDVVTESQSIDLPTAQSEPISLDDDIEQYIKITPATQPQQGPRQLILDTETTGFYYQNGDRIIEVGAIEMINRRLTGSSIHIYINPEKDVGDSENIHGLSNAFLADKPVFSKIAQVLYNYLKGAEIVAHNATFDMNFLNMEFEQAGFGALSDVCPVIDTLALAKQKHPGQKNSLDMLVRRYDIPPRDRTFHGALLDAEILSDVYLAMTGGQVSLDIDRFDNASIYHNDGQNLRPIVDIPLIHAHPDELAAHEEWIANYKNKHDKPALFEQGLK